MEDLFLDPLPHSGATPFTTGCHGTVSSEHGHSIDESSIDLYEDLPLSSIQCGHSLSHSSPHKHEGFDFTKTEEAARHNLVETHSKGRTGSFSSNGDLYTDCVEGELTLQEKLKTVETLNMKMITEVKQLRTQNEQLRKNISSLFLTAKQEIQEKDKEIAKLRSAVDSQTASTKDRSGFRQERKERTRDHTENVEGNNSHTFKDRKRESVIERDDVRRNREWNREDSSSRRDGHGTTDAKKGYSKSASRNSDSRKRLETIDPPRGSDRRRNDLSSKHDTSHPLDRKRDKSTKNTSPYPDKKRHIDSHVHSDRKKSESSATVMTHQPIEEKSGKSSSSRVYSQSERHKEEFTKTGSDSSHGNRRDIKVEPRLLPHNSMTVPIQSRLGSREDCQVDIIPSTEQVLDLRSKLKRKRDKEEEEAKQSSRYTDVQDVHKKVKTGSSNDDVKDISHTSVEKVLGKGSHTRVVPKLLQRYSLPSNSTSDITGKTSLEKKMETKISSEPQVMSPEKVQSFRRWEPQAAVSSTSHHNMATSSKTHCGQMTDEFTVAAMSHGHLFQCDQEEEQIKQQKSVCKAEEAINTCIKHNLVNGIEVRAPLEKVCPSTYDLEFNQDVLVSSHTPSGSPHVAHAKENSVLTEKMRLETETSCKSQANDFKLLIPEIPDQESVNTASNFSLPFANLRSVEGTQQTNHTWPFETTDSVHSNSIGPHSSGLSKTSYSHLKACTSRHDNSNNNHTNDNNVRSFPISSLDTDMTIETRLDQCGNEAKADLKCDGSENSQGTSDSSTKFSQDKASTNSGPSDAVSTGTSDSNSKPSSVDSNSRDVAENASGTGGEAELDVDARENADSNKTSSSDSTSSYRSSAANAKPVGCESHEETKLMEEGNSTLDSSSSSSSNDTINSEDSVKTPRKEASYPRPVIPCTANLIMLGDEETSCTTFTSPSKSVLLPSEFYPPGVRGTIREEGSHYRHIRGDTEALFHPIRAIINDGVGKKNIFAASDSTANFATKGKETIGFTQQVPELGLQIVQPEERIVFHAPSVNPERRKESSANVSNLNLGSEEEAVRVGKLNAETENSKEAEHKLKPYTDVQKLKDKIVGCDQATTFSNVSQQQLQRSTGTHDKTFDEVDVLGIVKHKAISDTTAGLESAHQNVQYILINSQDVTAASTIHSVSPLDFHNYYEPCVEVTKEMDARISTDPSFDTWKSTVERAYVNTFKEELSCLKQSLARKILMAEDGVAIEKRREELLSLQRTVHEYLRSSMACSPSQRPQDVLEGGTPGIDQSHKDVVQDEESDPANAHHHHQGSDEKMQKSAINFQSHDPSQLASVSTCLPCDESQQENKFDQENSEHNYNKQSNLDRFSHKDVQPGTPRTKMEKQTESSGMLQERSGSHFSPEISIRKCQPYKPPSSKDCCKTASADHRNRCFTPKQREGSVWRASPDSHLVSSSDNCKRASMSPQDSRRTPDISIPREPDSTSDPSGSVRLIGGLEMKQGPSNIEKSQSQLLPKNERTSMCERACKSFNPQSLINAKSLHHSESFESPEAETNQLHSHNLLQDTRTDNTELDRTFTFCMLSDSEQGGSDIEATLMRPSCHSHSDDIALVPGHGRNNILQAACEEVSLSAESLSEFDKDLLHRTPTSDRDRVLESSPDLTSPQHTLMSKMIKTRKMTHQKFSTPLKPASDENLSNGAAFSGLKTLAQRDRKSASPQEIEKNACPQDVCKGKLIAQGDVLNMSLNSVASSALKESQDSSILTLIGSPLSQAVVFNTQEDSTIISKLMGEEECQEQMVSDLCLGDEETATAASRMLSYHELQRMRFIKTRRESVAPTVHHSTDRADEGCAHSRISTDALAFLQSVNKVKKNLSSDFGEKVASEGKSDHTLLSDLHLSESDADSVPSPVKQVKSSWTETLKQDMVRAGNQNGHGLDTPMSAQCNNEVDGLNIKSRSVISSFHPESTKSQNYASEVEDLVHDKNRELEKESLEEGELEEDESEEVGENDQQLHLISKAMLKVKGPHTHSHLRLKQSSCFIDRYQSPLQQVHSEDISPNGYGLKSQHRAKARRAVCGSKSRAGQAQSRKETMRERDRSERYEDAADRNNSEKHKWEVCADRGSQASSRNSQRSMCGNSIDGGSSSIISFRERDCGRARPLQERSKPSSKDSLDRKRSSYRDSPDRNKSSSRNSQERKRPSYRDSQDRNRPSSRNSQDRNRPSSRNSQDRSRPSSRNSQASNKPSSRRSQDRKRPSSRNSLKIDSNAL